jgi:predicted nuclease of predicted toxin-antitoxin system
MKVRFQADADLSELILKILLRRAPGVDFQTARVAGLSGMPDPDVLALAAGEDRVLVTHDQSTMPGHFRRFISHQKSPGVLIVPQNFEIHEAAEELLLIWEASDAEEWINRIEFLPL